MATVHRTAYCLAAVKRRQPPVLTVGMVTRQRTFHPLQHKFSQLITDNGCPQKACTTMAETIKELRLFFRTAQTQIAIPHFGTQASSNLQQRQVTYGWQNRFGVLIEEFNDLGGGIERPLIRFISGANDQLAIFARTKVAPMVFDEVGNRLTEAV